MIKGFPNVLILYSLGHLTNFQITTWDSLQFKPISNLTIVFYHQNLIRKTLSLTKSLTLDKDHFEFKVELSSQDGHDQQNDLAHGVLEKKKKY